MKNILFTFLALVTLAPLQAQQNAVPSFISDSLEQYIAKGMQEWRVPGLSLVIVKDGEVLWRKGYGHTTPAGTRAVDEATLFMIGSNTKLFTATALASLEAEGLLKLTDPVQKWLPEFQLKDAAISPLVNIADLLSHRIGFETFQGDFTYWTSQLTRAEIIQKMATIEAPYPFRSRWGYCNACFVTAGEILPKVHQKSWSQTIQEKILDPLQMDQTLLLYEDLLAAPNKAMPYTILADSLHQLPFSNIDNLAAAGSISSNANDMATWLLAQLNNGKIGEQQVLPQAAIRAPRRARSIRGIDSRDNQNTHFYLYGLGLTISDRDGKMVYSHTGGVDGFLSSVIMVPEENLGIAVMTNTDQNSFFQSLAFQIQDAFFQVPYYNYSEENLQGFLQGQATTQAKRDSLRREIQAAHPTSLSLSQYTGTYLHPVYGSIDIQLKNNSLQIHFSNHPKLIGHLEHIKADQFLCTYSNPTMGIEEQVFHIEEGRVKGLSLRVADYLEFHPYEFVKQE